MSCLGLWASRIGTGKCCLIWAWPAQGLLRVLVAGCTRLDSREAKSCSRTGARNGHLEAENRDETNLGNGGWGWHPRFCGTWRNTWTLRTAACQAPCPALSLRMPCQPQSSLVKGQPSLGLRDLGPSPPACSLSMAAPCKRWGGVYDLLLEDSRIGVQEQVNEKWSVRAIEHWGTTSYQGCQKPAGCRTQRQHGMGTGLLRAHCSVPSSLLFFAGHPRSSLEMAFATLPLGF